MPRWKRKKASEKEKDLQGDIQKIERKQFKTEKDIKDSDENNKQLILLRENKMEGVLLRSKAKWVAEGEKITKYVCSLEKRNYISKQMTKLINKKGADIKESSEIKEEFTNFDRSLNEARALEECNIEDLITRIPTLSSEESNSLEGKITLDEAGIALKNMKNGKNPGTYGFGAEFCKCFLKKVRIICCSGLE